ncbi:helix-turn-helix domain-containing protein [Desulfohalobiaceae bacterium Ax17]|jgi:cytoskeleton protein RodZ|uniref:helix-turn-helix domain-containing protein n=1 Tax=Desulfovulcanus ferrireducens TaxID=2831190 RepID=UPI00207B9BD5|nr:RodZ domain-containing protein [Desulfovulcanus ferrireducens]MBT8763164.1 helix-turn-helix domain-containing protein [Desulfovulcanus ferrireducens]
MDLLELGQKLKEERENQGLTLEQIQQKTKISVQILKAIEQGDTSLLPHPVYAKGFVQNYARILGLDWRDIGDRFASLYSADEEYELLEELPTSFKTKSRQRRLFKLLKLILFIALGAILAFFAWSIISSVFFPDQDMQSINKNSSLLQENHRNESELPQNGNEVISQSIPKQDANNASGVDDKVSNTKETAANENNIAKQEKLPTKNDLEETDKQEKVTIDAFEPCWVQAEIDEEQKEFYLRAGEKIDLKFTKSLRLRLGNAGGVKLFYNDEDYPLQAQSGQVKTLEFASSD